MAKITAFRTSGTDIRTYGRTDRPSYRDARTHLKKEILNFQKTFTFLSNAAVLTFLLMGDTPLGVLEPLFTLIFLLTGETPLGVLEPLLMDPLLMGLEVRRSPELHRLGPREDEDVAEKIVCLL